MDGANLNMDIQPLGGSAHDPFDIDKTSHDIQWLAEQYPLTIHGQDLWANANCDLAAFRLTRKILSTGKPYGFVPIDINGQPIGGDHTVACFSNCARYAFPTPPKETCNENFDPLCFRWKALCLGDPSKYGGKCKTDADCPVLGACWDNPGSKLNMTCQGRAFIKNASCP